MKNNWKLIKKLISEYKGGGEQKCVPIFAYKNTFPVNINTEFVDIFNNEFAASWKGLKKKSINPELGLYNFFISSIKKNINNADYFLTKIVINKTDSEEEPVVEERLFSSEIQIFEYKNFICVPNRIFDTKNKEKDIIVFDGSELNEKEYLEIIDLWINQANKS